MRSLHASLRLVPTKKAEVRMTDHTDFGAFVDHVMSDDDSELGKVKAERDYALHCLEREIAICADTQRLLWLVVKTNDGYELEIEELQDYPGDDRAILTQFQDPVTNSITLRATIKERA
jgi:hypothetical protein